MKINKILVIFYLVIFLPLISHSQEIDFEASDIKIVDENKIIAFNSKTNIPSNNILVESDEVEYNKEKNLLIFKGNVLLIDKENRISIKSNKIRYDRNLDLINSLGDTLIIIKNIYKIQTVSINYDQKNQNIYSDEDVNMEDNENNYYSLKVQLKVAKVTMLMVMMAVTFT